MDISSALIIRPNDDDDWEVTPPFKGIPLGGANGYIIATTDEVVVGFSDYKLLPNEVLRIDNTYNQFDFLQKTTGDAQRRNISFGIGGIAKAKDWGFSVINDRDTETGFLDVVAITGREIELRTYEPSDLSNDINATFTSIAISVVINTRVNNRVTEILLQGRIAVSNPRIAGTPFVDFNGNTTNNWIFIGDSQLDINVPLKKVKGIGGAIQLAFDATKYELQKILLKDNTLDEFYTVTAPFKVENGLVFFEDSRHLILDFFQSKTSNDFIELQMDDFGIVSVLTDTETYENRIYYQRGTEPRSVDLILRFTFVLGGKTWGSYKCPQSFLFPAAQDDLRDVTKIQPHGSTGVTNFPIVVEQLVFVENPIIDYPFYTLAFDLVSLGADVEPLDFVVQEPTVISAYRTSSIRGNDKILEIIKIRDEEFLVHYVEQHYNPGSSRLVLVTRAFNGTAKEDLFPGDEVTFLSSERTQQIEMEINVPLENILSVPTTANNAEVDFTKYNRVTNLSKWLDGSVERFDITFTLDHLDVNYSDEELRAFWGQWYATVILKYSFPDIVATLKRAVLNSDVLVSYPYSGIGNNCVAVHFSFEQTEDTPSIDISFLQGTEGERHSRTMVGYDITDSELIPFIRQFDETPAFRPPDFSSVDYEDLAPILDLSSVAYKINRETPPGVLPIIVEEKTKAKIQLNGAWGTNWWKGSFLSGALIEYTLDSLTGTSLNVTDYNVLKDITMGLSIYDYTRSFQPPPGKITVSTKKLTIATNLFAPIKDNEWFGQVKNLSQNNGTVLTDSFALGANASIFLDEPNGFLFAESDTIPLIVFQLTATGTLIQLDIALLATYPNLGDGLLVRLTNSKRITKVRLETSPNLFRYISVVAESEPSYPGIEQVEQTANGLSYSVIGTQDQENKTFLMTIDSGTLKIFKKVDLSKTNPVNVIKTLLTDSDLGNHPLSDLDIPAFDDIESKRVGWVASLLIEEEINVNQIIDEVAKNHALMVYENNEGKISISDLIPPPINEVTQIIEDAQILYRGNKKPHITERTIHSNYLITEMDIRFKPFGNEFKGIIKSENFAFKSYFDTAKEFTTQEAQVALNLKSIYDKETATKAGEAKMNFHKHPSRILTLGCTYTTGLAQTDLGTWLLLDSSHLDGTNGRIFLLIESKIQVPYKGTPGTIELTLYQYDHSRIIQNIQEVIETPNVEFQEVISSPGDEIQEVFESGGL